MTATSGPGFSLMQENLGYAVAAEIPCVLVDVQRLGPSTGQPTAPSQGDVMQARWGTHGDHPIIVLCESTVRGCVLPHGGGVQLLGTLPHPGILLLDEVLGHMREPFDVPETMRENHRPHLHDVPPEWYFPYDDPSADVPPLVSFGEGFRYHITGLLHDRAGFPTQRQDEIVPWWRRVFAKIDAQPRNTSSCTRVTAWSGRGPSCPAYGSTARSAARAVAPLARAKRHKVGLLVVKTLWPFHESP